MKDKLIQLCLIAIFFTAFITPAEAGIVIQNGKIAHSDTAATLPVQDHFSLAVDALNRKDWNEASIQFKIVVLNFPQSSYALDSHYFLGIAYFYLSEFDVANDEFSEYLKAQHHPKYFEHAIEFKYAIAERFKDGARRRLLGWKQMPKWASGKKSALTIYDEVIASLPCHQLAAKALYAKANLLWEMKEYRESIECFQILIKRFPKHEFAPDCHLAITEVYLEQSRNEFQNPDLLALAQINLRRFKLDFPRRKTRRSRE